MSIAADLNNVQTDPEVAEALAKPIGYALSPRLWIGLRALFACFRTPRSLCKIADRAKKSEADRHIARQFIEVRGIKRLSAFGDPRSGFELLTFVWGETGILVFVGSDDLLDWKRNLFDRAIGLPAFLSNQYRVSRAIERLRARGCRTIEAYGHSRGGAIAQYAYVCFEAIVRCVTYQSAVPADDLPDVSLDRSGEVWHFQHQYDLVPGASRLKTGGDLLPGRIFEFEPPRPYLGTRRSLAHTMPIVWAFRDEIAALRETTRSATTSNADRTGREKTSE